MQENIWNPLTRREEKESQIDDLVAELHTTHELNEPQYRLVTFMYGAFHMGLYMHESLINAIQSSLVIVANAA